MVMNEQGWLFKKFTALLQGDLIAQLLLNVNEFKRSLEPSLIEFQPTYGVGFTLVRFRW